MFIYFMYMLYKMPNVCFNKIKIKIRTIHYWYYVSYIIIIYVQYCLFDKKSELSRRVMKSNKTDLWLAKVYTEVNTACCPANEQKPSDHTKHNIIVICRCRAIEEISEICANTWHTLYKWNGLSKDLRSPLSLTFCALDQSYCSSSKVLIGQF